MTIQTENFVSINYRAVAESKRIFTMYQCYANNLFLSIFHSLLSSSNIQR